jgi:hypothetical protein
MNGPRWRTEPLTSDRNRKGPQGRKRSGPDGVAVRELARVTIRARGAVLAKWDVLREAENLAPHEFFELLVESYFTRLDPDRQGEILRAVRRRRRDHYANVP